MRPAGNRALFISDAKSQFLSFTRSRYSAMQVRLRKKKLPVPFTLEQMRIDLYVRLTGYDAPATCPYCKSVFVLNDMALDHAVPLARGGDPALCNLELVCKLCNQRKGQLNPQEYKLLIAFLEDVIPFAKTDVLSRMAKAVPLAAGMRYQQMQRRAKATQVIQ